MTLYPPSSWVESTVPVDNGGCGETHRRPYVEGRPVHPYGLECPPCEDYLRKAMGDQWSANIADIVETYNEKTARERAEKTGKLDRERQLADALTQLGPLGQLPAALTQFVAQMTGVLPPAVQGVMECPNGHAAQPGAKFCPECAAPLSVPVTAGAIGPPPPVQETAKAASKRQRLRDARLEDLQHLARDRMLDASGSRADLISRLSAAGVTSNDLNSLAAA